MAGLNDSFLLADDSLEPKEEPVVTIDAFKDTVDEEGTPELRDDIDLIAVAAEEFSIQMRDLELLRESVASHGGMSQTIALEAHALIPDFINDDRPIGFFTKHPSRTMLSVALEEIDDQKKTLVARMIDAIVSFIGRLLKRIKAIFIVDEATQKQNSEFAKNYKGPTDEDLTKAVNEFAQKAANAKGQSADGAKAAATNSKNMSLDEAMVLAEKVSGQKVTKERARDFFKDTKMALITAMLGKDRLAIVTAMIDKNFAKDYDEALRICYDLTASGSAHSDDWSKDFDSAQKLTEYVTKCHAALAEAAAKPESEQRKTLLLWIAGRDIGIVHHVHGYFAEDRTPYMGISHGSPKYLENLQKDVERLQGDTSPEALENLKKVQTVVSAVNSFISVMVRVSSAYNTVLKGLRK